MIPRIKRKEQNTGEKIKWGHIDFWTNPSIPVGSPKWWFKIRFLSLFVDFYRSIQKMTVQDTILFWSPVTSRKIIRTSVWVKNMSADVHTTIIFLTSSEVTGINKFPMRPYIIKLINSYLGLGKNIRELITIKTRKHYYYIFLSFSFQWGQRSKLLVKMNSQWSHT